MLTPYQALSHKGLNLPLSFALFPPLLLDPLTTLPQVIPDPQNVQHHIDYDPRCFQFRLAMPHGIHIFVASVPIFLTLFQQRTIIAGRKPVTRVSNHQIPTTGMRKTTSIIRLVLVILTVCLGTVGRGKIETGDQNFDQLQANTKGFNDAIKSGDADKKVSLFTKHTILVPNR
jgi:hypothetical protein